MTIGNIHTGQASHQKEMRGSVLDEEVGRIEVDFNWLIYPTHVTGDKQQ